MICLSRLNTIDRRFAWRTVRPEAIAVRLTGRVDRRFDPRRQLGIVIIVIAVLSTSAWCSAIPPLTDEQQVRLETAHDGRDHREEAFVALVENMREWDGGIGDTPVRIQPNVDAMLLGPDHYRGEIVRINGRVAQITPLPAPHAGVWECFVRDQADQPILLYIVTGTANGAPLAVRAGSRIEIFARFYKPVSFTARDGQERSYAAFVGAHPRTVSGIGAGGGVTHLAVVSIALLALFVVFLLLILALRRQRGRRQRPASARLSAESVPPELDDTADLPDDPAEALTELRRRMNHAEH